MKTTVDQGTSAQNPALQVQPPTAQVASFNGPSFQLPLFVPKPLFQSIGVPAAVAIFISSVATSGNQAYSFTLQESPDGVNWTNCGITYQVTAANVATALSTAAGELAKLTLGAFLSTPYVRLALAISGTSPSITYQAFLNINNP